MWGRKRQPAEAARASEPRPERLKDALRKARVDQAERNARRRRPARCRGGTARAPGRGARLAVRGNPQRGRSVRSRHQPGRDAAPVDRFHRPCGHGPRQADVPVPAGHPLRPQGAGRIRQHPRDRRGGDEISGAAPDRARTRARRRLAAGHRATSRRRRGWSAAVADGAASRRLSSACSRAARS